MGFLVAATGVSVQITTHTYVIFVIGRMIEGAGTGLIMLAGYSLILNLVSRFVATLLISLFGVGLSSIFLKLLYDQPASPRGLITGFLENADNCIRVRFYITFGEFVCLMPLQIFLSLVPSQSLTKLVPAAAALAVFCLAGYIYWSLTFAMADFLLLDFPEMSADRIIRAAHTISAV